MEISEIKKLCSDYGIKPSKGKGQNFLIDGHVLRQIIDAADLSPQDFALEVGPGFGILTEQLVKNCHKVLCVELDKSLVFFLKKKFSAAGGKGLGNLEILEADILKIKNQEIADRLGSANYKIVANIPYAITKPIIQKFLTYAPKPTEITVLIQKEVAEKIVAKPGEMSILAISVQYYGEPKIVNFVSKQSFFPVPKVDSAILKIIVNKDTFPAEFSQILTKKEQENFVEKKFWQLVKIGFSSPRKQLQNNLANGLKIDNSEVKNRLKKAGLKELCRAQDLSLADWARLYQQFMV
jgi:16S rRNA (adenine1518-N6/adenine1519-N6)-dimethyltransferase